MQAFPSKVLQVKKQPLNAACFTIQLTITQLTSGGDRVDREKDSEKDERQSSPPLNYNCRLTQQNSHLAHNL